MTGGAALNVVPGVMTGAGLGIGVGVALGVPVRGVACAHASRTAPRAEAETASAAARATNCRRVIGAVSWRASVPSSGLGSAPRCPSPSGAARAPAGDPLTPPSAATGPRASLTVTAASSLGAERRGPAGPGAAGPGNLARQLVRPRARRGLAADLEGHVLERDPTGRRLVRDEPALAAPLRRGPGHRARPEEDRDADGARLDARYVHVVHVQVAPVDRALQLAGVPDADRCDHLRTGPGGAVGAA